VEVLPPGVSSTTGWAAPSVQLQKLLGPLQALGSLSAEMKSMQAMLPPQYAVPERGSTKPLNSYPIQAQSTLGSSSDPANQVE